MVMMVVMVVKSEVKVAWGQKTAGLSCLESLPITGQAQCFGPAASPTPNTRNHSVCAGDDCNTTHTVAT
jgi:hypothetical protein